MWFKLTGLILVEVFLVGLLLAPIPTHVQIYDPASPVQHKQDDLTSMLAVGSIVVWALVIYLPWIAFKIVKRRR